MPFIKVPSEDVIPDAVPVVDAAPAKPIVDPLSLYDPARDHILWTGFNFIEVYHFCSDADHRLHHETVWIPGIGLVRRGTMIYRNPSGYYLKDEVSNG